MMKKNLWITLALIAVTAAFVISMALRIRSELPDGDLDDNGRQTRQYAEIEPLRESDIAVDFRAEGDSFYIKDGDGWKGFFSRGVIIGLTEATVSLANPNTSYETYMEWFEQISRMQANTVRVYTVMNPNFYNAFYDFNQNSSDPLYLIQGVWFNEEFMQDPGDAFAGGGMILSAFKRGIRETVDIINGQSDYTEYGEFAPAVYDRDVSQFVTGYVLGLEWLPEFVEATNLNEGKTYSGDFMYCSAGAAPFEAFLCEAGDYLAMYETTAYRRQTPVAFLNWATTDLLTHDNEPFEYEDRVSVDTRNILATENYLPGQFAAIDAYPYYPEFINYQPEYLGHIDGDGKKNPYKAYLADLKGEYDCPIIVAEVGLSTARGVAHQSAMGYNQGGLTEKQQGEYLADILEDIYDLNYAGAMIFSWQDEWFKGTWNAVNYQPEDAADRTPNPQSAEQYYGILAMEPGEEQTCVIDGLSDDWLDHDLVSKTDQGAVYTKYDEAYLYILADVYGDFDFDRDTVVFPIKTSGRGSLYSREFGYEFGEAADFLLVISGRNASRLLCDAYNDVFYYRYSVMNEYFEKNLEYSVSGAGIYNNINMFVSGERVLPKTGVTYPAEYIETGLLKFGTTATASENYDNLADFCYNGSIVEIRIPWSLLGVVNATEKTGIADFYELREIAFEQVADVRIGMGYMQNEKILLSSVNFHGLDGSTYRTRLKQSYEYIQKVYRNLL